MTLRLIDGNEAVAWGAVAAGCRFFAGYPITPATGVYNAMLALLPPLGGVCLQGEDEIASMGFCIGASMAGAKVLTATSGPGISLYSEHISFAIAGEIPLVIVDVQRLGPSTGSATRGADGDIQFLRWGNSGGLPVIVLAPVDVGDCYLLTVQAFNLAETYRCPVFVASNKEIAMTRETVPTDLFDHPPAIRDRRAPADPRHFRLFTVPDGRDVPDFLPMGDATLVRQCSSTHGPDGYITTDVATISATQDRLRRKLEDAVDRFAMIEARLPDEPETLIVTYGVTARAAAEAHRRLEETGRAVGLMVLKTLWPVPAAAIRRMAAGFKRVVVVEMNLGQYVREIERLLPGVRVDFAGEMNGTLVTPERIVEEVRHG